jgi:uncharacterized protein
MPGQPIVDSRSWAAKGMLVFLEAYRLLLSPWIGQSCRFEPTCSRYAREAIETHGASVGAYLGACRLLRCHPWCDAGYDPVASPDQRRQAFRAARQRLLTRFTKTQ